MSQRGPAPRPASRPSSRSPVRHQEESPRQHVPPHGGGNARPESVGMPTAEDGRRSQYLPPKALGVHNILNPSEPHFVAAEGPRPFSSRPSDAGSTAFPSRTFPRPRLFYQAHAGLVSHPATPLGRPSSSGRNSPVTAFPFHSVNDPRRASSPRLPRATFPSQAIPSHERVLRPQSFVSASSSAKRPYETEADDGRHHPGPHHGPGRGLISSQMTSPRAAGHPLARGGEASYAPSHTRHQSLHAPPQFQHGAPPSRPLSAIGGPGDGLAPWSDAMRRSGGMAGADGQQAFMTLPGSDTPIPVQVDYSQASKKADEKRQRNAKASTRHRRKKKTMQEENARQLQDLKDERQQLMEELDGLRRQRDFYRDDRNRLREIVARTPGIHQHAGGPASPSEQGSDSHTERSPGQHSQMPTPSQGYASDPSSVERPAQRRRTDDRPEFSAPVYGASVGPPPPTLASGASGYGVPVRPPSAASSGGGERLPPFRAIDGPPAGQGMGAGQPQEQDPRTGQWRRAQPRQYETGWATAPRQPYDGHAPQWH
ncbi:hypothetical protein G6O67_003247 [Ophiocordyceps sinensis]|uniref:BZIP domain-containing protein n=3 Tax=Ophiocordyceps sinensis TaxID=72228 RepID=A0A8H4PVX0_9HYPO|nr:transcription factor bZIP [Ophiocordyceps sinensis CO18]KAF4511448.1 hypothetical protein G6O67_003247 [Ophiocordyceps sinensis]